MAAQGQRIVNEDLGTAEPRLQGKHHLAQKRKRRLRRIQTSEPSAQGGWIGHANGIFDCGRRSFAGTAFQEVTPQSLAAGDEAVMAVGRRERREESERLPAPVTNAAPNPDPIMLLVMRLFAAAAVTDDGVLGANRAAAQDDFGPRLGPIGFEVVLRGRKWDKQNRSNEGFALPVTLPRSSVGRRGALPSSRISTGKE